MEVKDLIDAIDIVDYIGQFVDLTEKNGEYWGLSPFKDEKTPSFSVRRETNNFYDFSSGIGGNVYTFVKYYNKCSAREAVDILIKYLGGTIVDSPSSRKLTATLVCRRYRPPNKNHKEFKTKLYSKDYMSQFDKRQDKLNVWEAEGISADSLEKFQVRYDEFSNRLVYPIRNLQGDIVNIGGRTLDPQWKEKNLRKYTYFSGWGELNVIYGMYENMDSILQSKEVILFEGCKSVLLADTYGIHNTGALLTSHLNPEQLKILAKLGVRAVFALDKDVNIFKDHNIKRLKQYVTVEYLYDRDNLLDAKDSPVDKGSEVFKTLYDNRKIYK